MWVFPQAADLGLAIDARDGARLRAAGELVKAAARAQCPVQHPTFDYPGPDIMAFRGPWRRGAVATNTVVMSNGYSGMLDRSPCGSGTCAIMALLQERPRNTPAPTVWGEFDRVGASPTLLPRPPSLP